jgi:hypothetical protein
VRLKEVLIVHALKVSEALGARDLAIFKAQPGDAVPADGGVGAAVGRHKGEAADRQPG